MPLPPVVPDTLAESAHPVWLRGDWFRAIFFGALGVVYAVLLFPLVVAALILWLVGKAVAKAQVG